SLAKRSEASKKMSRVPNNGRHKIMNRETTDDPYSGSARDYRRASKLVERCFCRRTRAVALWRSWPADSLDPYRSDRALGGEGQQGRRRCARCEGLRRLLA